MSGSPIAPHLEVGSGALGVVSDIHANPFALAEVLDHGERNGVKRWLVLGDVVALGPEPGRVLAQLNEVDVIAFIAGNTERYVLTGDRQDPSLDEFAADPQLLPRLVETAASFAWTKGYLQACGSLDQLRTFQPSARLRMADGTILLAVHASLLADDGRGIAPDVDVDEMNALFPQPDASLVFGGHTHKAADLSYNGIRFVNPGSVSNHHDQPHLGARYSIVRLGHDEPVIEHHEVGYNKQLVIDSINASGSPGASFLLNRYFAA